MQNTVLNDDTRSLSEAGQSDNVYGEYQHYCNKNEFEMNLLHNRGDRVKFKIIPPWFA